MRRITELSIGLVLFLGIALSRAADQPVPTNTGKQRPETDGRVVVPPQPEDVGTKRAEAEKDRKKSDDLLKGLGFGVGVGAVFDMGGSPRVKSATVDSKGIIRVDGGDSARVGAILETHYLFGYDNY